MNSDFHTVDGVLAVNRIEFDSLEKKLQKLDSPRDVMEMVTDWLISQFNPSFVLFCTDGENSGISIKYFRQVGKLPASVESYVRERKADGEELDLFVHKSGCISVPFGYSSSETGWLYIGPPVDGTPAYSQIQLKKVNPVVRILNKRMLVLEAERLHQEKNRLQYAFSRYVSPDVVQNIVENETGIQIGGEKQCLTAIFTDLRGFTAFTESMDSSVLVRVLNMYLNEMTQVIIALGGTIDKFEGDAIMAFFGAPHKLEDHAVRCCLAALRMKKMEALLNEQLLREKLISTPFFTRIGINTGEMIVGNVGSLQRLDYTIIGSNVNIASRIENANKRYHTSVMISGSTFRLVAQAFECQYVDTAYLKGVHQPVALYELLYERPGAVPDYSNYASSHPDSIAEPVSADQDIPELENL